jgi:hypothetical protein
MFVSYLPPAPHPSRSNLQNQNYNLIRRHLAEIPPAYSPKPANILLPRLLKPTICRRWQALPLLSRHAEGYTFNKRRQQHPKPYPPALKHKKE